MIEIKNDCEHKNGFLFTLDITRGQCWGTLTGSDPDTINLNRYCKDCREQMGTRDLSYSDELSKLEFTSPEMEEWFKEQKGE